MSSSSDLPPDPAIDPDIAPPPRGGEDRQRVDETNTVRQEAEETPAPDVVSLTREEENLFLQLATVGRRHKTVTIFDHKVSIQTLNVDDDLRVSMFTRDYRESDGYGRAYQLATCAAGIKAIDGKELYKPLGPEALPEEEFTAKVEKLRTFYPIVLSQIYNAIIRLDAEFAELAVKLGKLPG